MAEKVKNHGCQLCGMITDNAAEYHPWIVCQLFKAGIPSNVIKANLHAVLDHGRRLERQGLPNDALISEVKFDEPSESETGK